MFLDSEALSNPRACESLQSAHPPNRGARAGRIAHTAQNRWTSCATHPHIHQPSPTTSVSRTSTPAGCAVLLLLETGSAKTTAVPQSLSSYLLRRNTWTVP